MCFYSMQSHVLVITMLSRRMTNELILWTILREQDPRIAIIGYLIVILPLLQMDQVACDVW